MLKILDIFLELVHILVILFSLIGWIFPRSRKLHRYHLATILISWLGLGYFYGFGYCFLTEWHWQVKSNLGVLNLPPSYITYLLEKINLNIFSEITVEFVTAFTLLLSILANLYLSYKERKSSF